MSTKVDTWAYLVARIQDGLGGYKPSPLIAEVIKILLKNKYEGMIVVDEAGRVAFMDKPTEKLFGLQPGGAKRMPFSDFFPDLGILEVLKTGVPQIGQIQEVGGQKKIVTRFPVIKDGRIIGAVGKVIFHEMDAIKDLSAKVERLEAKISRYREGLMAMNRATYTFDSILGKSEAITKAKKLARRIASLDCTVLLLGDSGTGKELFAHAIHRASDRSNGPFVRVNCAGIPIELAESELFGYEKGAFTGASNVGQKGKFELASGGTIFLDEISSMPLTIQAKLLRVIQEKEVQPLGSQTAKKVDFRLVAASNADLSRLVERGSFRADLYYRLNSVPLYIPPLSARREDVPFLVNALLPRINKELSGTVQCMTSRAITRLSLYRWPGNIRELINAIEQAVLNAYPRRHIDIKDLPEFLQNRKRTQTIELMPISRTLSHAEKEAIRSALAVTGGNKRKAAMALGISRAALYKKLNRIAHSSR